MEPPTPPQDPPSRDLVTSSGAVATGTGFTATFDVSVVYKGNTYTLNVLPKTAGGVYGVQILETLADGHTTNDILEFAIKDQKNWGVKVDLPLSQAGLTIGGVTIKTLDISFGEGTAVFPHPPA